MNVMDHMNAYIKERDDYVTRGLLRCDDLDDLRVYTYTNSCKHWDYITMNSRGIIVNRKTGEIVSQPFPKFFNMGQRQETQEHNLPWHEGFRIFEKCDGWLGILYRHNGQYKIATRGSFKSTGALWATKILNECYRLDGLPDEVTLLFELISPLTKIVVDYGQREDLVLLGAYNRHTGEEYQWDQVQSWGEEFGFLTANSWPKEYLGYCRGLLKSKPGNELEGFIIRFANGLRIKIKSEDYFRRSKILQQINPLGIWDIMQNGNLPEYIWNMVDKDYHEDIEKIYHTLASRYRTIREEIDNQYKVCTGASSRNVFAKIAKTMSHAPAMFCLLDKQDNKVDEYIMKKIRPKNNILENE